MLTAVEGARASTSLPGFHPAWLDMASHFGLQVGKTWKRRLLTDQNYMLSALALGAVRKEHRGLRLEAVSPPAVALEVWSLSGKI